MLELRSVEDARTVNVFGNGMLPLYRHGDQLIVSANVPIKTGDRVLLEMKNRSQICGTLFRKTADLVGINVGGQSRKAIQVKASEIVFLGRVIWASQ